MIERDLNDVEIRVLGCLVEKAAVTPDNYPLSSNALVAACNQKTSRDPVADHDERTVDAAMLTLRERGLARSVRGGTARVVKHRHVVDEALGLDDAELAVLSVLMLRGPQTPGELRSRCERQHPFGDLADVHDTLDALAARTPPLVAEIGRAAGQKETRFGHLLSADAEAELPEPARGDWAPSDSEPARGDWAPSTPEPARPAVAPGTTESAPSTVPGVGRDAPSAAAESGGSDSRAELVALRREVAELRAAVDELRRELGLGPTAP